jgi:hypothetical protein
MAAVSTSTTIPSAPTAGLEVQRLGSDALGLDRGATGGSSVACLQRFAPRILLPPGTPTG